MRPRDHVGAGLGRDLPRGARVGRVARIRGDRERFLEERRRGRGLRELGRELAVGQMQRALLDQRERGRVPECRRAAVAERHLIAVGRGEQLAQTSADVRDERLDRGLAMGGAHHRRAVLGQARERLRADPRGTRAEAPVGGLQLVGDNESRVCCRGARRHVGSSFGLEGMSMIGDAQARGSKCSSLPGG